MKRRLAAVLAADMVGYSRLMAADEAGTLARQSAIRKKLIDPKVAEYGGSVVKSTGDGVLVEFPSVVDALRCAVTVQIAMAEREAAYPIESRITYRIGINLGDIMVEDDDIYGDGVNVASRLEALAEPGGVCVSRTVVDHVKGKVASSFEDLGKQDVKNLPEPIHVFRVLMKAEAIGKTPGWENHLAHWWRPIALAAAIALLVVGVDVWRAAPPSLQPASVERMAFPLPDKPSIAVLPFVNNSGDPSQEYFVDGMTEDLITDLSKIGSLFVISRNSSFLYKGRTVEPRKVAEDLGVRYVLEGSVRRSDDEVRVNAQLIDATTGGHLWADRYDGYVTNIFEVQDLFVQEIVGALALNLSVGEQKEFASGRTSNVQAREAFQKGWEHYLQYTAEDNAIAAEHLKRAAQIDPDYGRAYAALGLVYVRGCQWRWNEELGTTPSEAFDTAMAYLTKGEPNSSSLTRVAMSQLSLYDGEHNTAFTEAARAVALDPNDPEAQIAMGLAMITTGRPEAGLEFVLTALRLSPTYPNHYALAHGLAFFAMNDMGEAARTLATSLERDPNATDLAPLLAASYARLGRRSDARATLLKWIPGASQTELEDAVLSYHFPYKWANSEISVAARLRDGLFVAALPSDVTVESLLVTLSEAKEGSRRQSAARTLGKFGSAAKVAVPTLEGMLGDPDTRFVAKASLKKIKTDLPVPTFNPVAEPVK